VDGNVFLRHEWFSAAWAWQRSQADLYILCAYAGPRLVGVLPLIQARDTSPNKGPLKFLSVPDAQWCDLLAEPASARAVGPALAEHLLSSAPEWDQLCLDKLPADSAARSWLAPALAERNVPAHFESVDGNPFVDLSVPWSDYLGSLPRGIKKTRNLAANRLSRAGVAHVEWVTSRTASLPDVQRSLTQVVSLSARSWKGGTDNSLEAHGPNAFIQSLTASAHAQGWLSIWFLHLDGEAVAMEYQLLDKGVVYALRADFDDRYRLLSTGTFLNFHMLQELFNKPTGAALTRYCMGPGNNPYKLRWSDKAEPLYKMTCFSFTLRGRAGALWSGVKPRLRTLRDRLVS
jgi:CelD/BcsL family acetyltransferase involved in cellulose biosynthesis